MDKTFKTGNKQLYEDIFSFLEDTGRRQETETEKPIVFGNYAGADIQFLNSSNSQTTLSPQKLTKNKENFKKLIKKMSLPIKNYEKSVKKYKKAQKLKQEGFRTLTIQRKLKKVQEIKKDKREVDQVDLIDPHQQKLSKKSLYLGQSSPEDIFHEYIQASPEGKPLSKSFCNLM